MQVRVIPRILIYFLVIAIIFSMQKKIVFADEKSSYQTDTRQVAENDNFIMYYDEDTGVIGLENKQNHYIWWSSPPEAERDVIATPLVITELQSSAVLTYGNRKTRAVTSLRSGNSASLDAEPIRNGIIVKYQYEKCGITIPVCYVLEDDYMSVSVTCSDIQETKTAEGIIATQLTLLGSFGAGTSTEKGYFVIPDGCGSLIRFHNGKETAKSYSQKVYGLDITNVPTTKPAVTEKIYMPVYGIVKDGNAMTVIIEKGAGNATLNASVSGQSLSSFNICNFSFQLRGTDSYALSGNSGNLTVFETGEIKTEEIKLRYYPVADNHASYMNIAETYRNYLLHDENVQIKTKADTTELYLDLYGGTMKSHSVFGVPVTTRTSMTSYEQAQEIIGNLVENGNVNHMVVTYHNWTDAGISGKVDNEALPSNVLGGSSEFKKLKDYLSKQNIAFYPSVNNKVFDSGNGYYQFKDTAIRISGSYSRQIKYNLAYGIQDTGAKAKSLLSPGVFRTIYSKLAKNYAEESITGCAVGEMTSTLWGDYGKRRISRDDAIAELQVSYQEIQDAGLSLLADSCSAYAFPYVDRITDVPLQSSKFDIFDEDIPFYQIVMHGILPYSCTAINKNADSMYTFLKAVATGCNPAYDMIYAEASDLKDTDLDNYYYSYYAFWEDIASQEYQLASEILSDVSDKIIINYTQENDSSITTFEDGTNMIVNYAENTILINDMLYQLRDTERSDSKS